MGLDGSPMQAIASHATQQWGRCGERLKARGAGIYHLQGPLFPCGNPRGPQQPNLPRRLGSLDNWGVGVQSSALSHSCTFRTSRYHVLSPSTHEGRLIHPAYREQEQAKTACLILYTKGYCFLVKSTSARPSSFAEQQQQNSKE